MKIGGGGEGEAEGSKLKTMKKNNLFSCSSKWFLPAEESPVYNRVAVLREGVGGNCAKTLADVES